MNLPVVGKLSTDILIIATLGLIVTYGVLFGHAKVRTLALSSYVGLVLAQAFGDSLYKLAAGTSFLANISPSTVRIALYLVPVILLEFTRRKHDPAARRGIILTMILCVATSALIISGVIYPLLMLSTSSVSSGWRRYQSCSSVRG
jgi:hypothetical protein